MLLSSPTFLFFFLPASLALYFAAPNQTLKNLALVVLSLVFYAWGEPLLVPVLIASIGLNYLAGIQIGRRTGRGRKVALGLAVGANLTILAVFKYAVLAVPALDVLSAPASLNFGPPGLFLPLGLSIFTLLALSYVVEVYRGTVHANRRLSEVALYLAFFPTLVAGPISRYGDMARRLGRRRHSLGLVSAGLRIFVLGLAQKLLLGDQLTPVANALFDHVRQPNLAEAWTGALAYALQIYFDFAGYSNMAIGLGVAFGFSLPRNFNLPYRARSITEFWTRWQITLSAWFRDYVGRPLSGTNPPPWRVYAVLALAALLIGLWHGASWPLVAWGLWNGALLIAERAGLKRGLERLGPIAGWIYALLALAFGWVLFRAPDLGAAMAVWRGMIGLNGAGPLGAGLSASLGVAQSVLLVAAAIFAFLPFSSRRGHAAGPIRRIRAALRTRLPAAGALATVADGGFTIVLLFLAALVISGATASPFLGFRF